MVAGLEASGSCPGRSQFFPPSLGEVEGWGLLSVFFFFFSFFFLTDHTFPPLFQSPSQRLFSGFYGVARDLPGVGDNQTYPVLPTQPQVLN